MTGDECKTLFEEVFARELDGHALISNNSNWRQFPVVRNRQWFVGRSVLLGDAQASAHFSIGSGTRIAMEDSIALAEALTGAADGTPVATLLRAFADTRGPEKTKLIGASERSYLWYERIGEWIDRYTPHEFIYAFMTRTGRMNDARLAAQYPELFQLIRPQGQTA
jgi:2-polyprenyl-6-methoxyphenol hydroxylase-like FAD-dependent oxidoreductase